MGASLADVFANEASAPAEKAMDRSTGGSDPSPSSSQSSLPRFPDIEASLAAVIGSVEEGARRGGEPDRRRSHATRKLEPARDTASSSPSDRGSNAHLSDSGESLLEGGVLSGPDSHSLLILS